MSYRDSLVSLLKSQLVADPLFGAEVGVHRGATSQRLVSEFERLHLYLVDTWQEAETKTEDSLTALTQQQQHEFYGETLSRMRHYGNRYEVLRHDSVEAAAFMQPLDFAFIDADHSFDGCLRDVQAYWQIVKRGGILCGHDYDKADLPGVTLAVNEFAKNNLVNVSLTEGNIWWIRR